jgi:hypothetical protein
MEIGMEYAKQNKSIFVETSARDNEGIKGLFYNIALEAYQ